MNILYLNSSMYVTSSNSSNNTGQTSENSSDLMSEMENFTSSLMNKLKGNSSSESTAPSGSSNNSLETKPSFEQNMISFARKAKSSGLSAWVSRNKEIIMPILLSLITFLICKIFNFALKIALIFGACVAIGYGFLYLYRKYRASRNYSSSSS